MTGNLDKLRRDALIFVAGIDSRLFDSCLSGDLVGGLHDPESRASKAVEYLASMGNTPGGYAQWLVDADGKSPSPDEYLEIVQDYRRYAKSQPTGEDNQWAWDVDCGKHSKQIWKRKYAMKGLRCYFEDKKVREGNYERNTAQRSVFLTWTTNLEARCNSYDPDTLFRPIVEVGYTENFDERFANHVNGFSSNFIMNLTDNLLDRRWPGRFKLFQHVIYLARSYTQAWLGEVLMTQLVRGYIFGGTGFSYHPAGRNCHTAGKVERSHWQKISSKLMVGMESIPEKLERSRKTNLVEGSCTPFGHICVHAIRDQNRLHHSVLPEV